MYIVIVCSRFHAISRISDTIIIVVYSLSTFLYIVGLYTVSSRMCPCVIPKEY